MGAKKKDAQSVAGMPADVAKAIASAKTPDGNYSPYLIPFTHLGPVTHVCLPFYTLFDWRTVLQ